QTWAVKGEPQKAAADYTEAIRLAPKNAAARFARGQAWFSLKEFERALADFDEAIILAPKNPAYFQTRGWTWFVVRNHDRALADLSEAIRLDPQFAHAYFQRANVLSSASQIDRAIADFGDAIRLAPNPAIAAFYHYHRGLAFSHKSDFARAVLDYDAAISHDVEAKRRDPTHVGCCFGRANLLFVVRGQARQAKGEPDLAIADFDEAIRLAPTTPAR